MNDSMRVGVLWGELARRPDQLERIAQATGTPPVVGRPEAVPDVEVLVTGGVPDSVPAATPRLRLLQLTSAGVERLHDHPVWRSSIPIATASGVHGVQIAEHVLLLLLALRRRLPGYLTDQRAHRWGHDDARAAGLDSGAVELSGLTLGLIGYGHIGRGVAHLARAFGMRVLATSATAGEDTPLVIPNAAPYVDLPAVPAPTLEPDLLLPRSQLDTVLATADVLVICTALTAQTTHLLDAEALSKMKHGAYLINIARGRIVDEAALIEALRAGHLGGAGLDVTAEEPLPADSPLWDLPTVILTPHVSGRSEHYVERLVNLLLANLDCLRRGVPPLNAVDRQRGY